MATVSTATGEGGGGWASIARKDAPVEKKPDIQSLLSTDGLKTVVVDANAIIGGGVRLARIADQLFTVREVLAEVRDPASRFHLATLPVEIKCLEPSEDALTKVAQFARATGDVQSLSEVDMKLIALTYTLEAQVHGTDHIRTRPPPLVLTATKGGQRSKDPPGWGQVSNPEEWEGIDDEEDGSDNRGSRILGLKSLSLDSQEPISARNGAVSGPSSEKEALLNSASNEIPATAAVVSEVQNETATPVPVVDSAVVRDNQRDVKEPAEVDNLTDKAQSEQLREANSSESSHGGSSKPVENKQATQGTVDADGDEWERALSRSTRREYLKRAQRRALRQQLAESSAAVTEAGDLADNANLAGARLAEKNSDDRSSHGTAICRPELSAEDAKDLVFLIHIVFRGRRIASARY
ncbi:hypothetical protein R1flu_021013 [Riccia fluitans]|uniref:Ribonuclease PIN domain-containing protein n=1 Tax=Riccia fluitans TaxID=41844 RepID=A0ABD1ZNH2_9MARC